MEQSHRWRILIYDVPQYLIKITPGPQSHLFIQKLLRYSKLVRELRAAEESILNTRAALLEVEQWLLAEERQGTATRRQVADEGSNLDGDRT
jgi:hypothetical protein